MINTYPTQKKEKKLPARRKALVLTLLFVVSLYLGTGARAYWNARSEYEKGLSCIEKGDKEGALEHLERAITWYYPASPYASRAAELMWRMAEQEERKGNNAEAFRIYGRIRSAFYMCRGLYTPGKDWIRKCEKKMALAFAGIPTDLVTEKSKTFEQRANEELALLSGPGRPDPVWALIVELGFIGWMASITGFIFMALIRDGGVRVGLALFWGILFVCFFLLWLIGMSRA